MSLRRFILGILIIGSLLGVKDLQAQHYFGVSGGLGGGSARFYPPEEMGMVWGLKNFGAGWKYYSKEKYVGGVGAELNYMQRGYRLTYNDMPDTSYVRRVNSLMLPLIWQPHAYLFARNFKVFMSFGITFSYNFDKGSRWYEESNNSGIIAEGSYPIDIVKDNRWGYGLMGGFGFSYLVGRADIFAEGRYWFGYSDIMKHHNKYEGNKWQRTPLDNITISAGVYFRLGKKGILSPPSKKVAAKLEQKEIRRAQKLAATQQAEDSEQTNKQNIEDGEHQTGESSQTDTERP